MSGPINAMIHWQSVSASADPIKIPGSPLSVTAANGISEPSSLTLPAWAIIVLVIAAAAIILGSGLSLGRQWQKLEQLDGL